MFKVVGAKQGLLLFAANVERILNAFWISLVQMLTQTNPNQKYLWPNF